MRVATTSHGARTKLDASGDTLATLVKLEGEDGPEVWIALQNFYAISRYNRSPLYSLAVYQLSTEIAAQVGGQSAPK